MPDHKKEYIKYRLAKSDEALEAAKLLAQNESWNSALNRLYYAAFYSVSALLLQKGINTKTHTGSKMQFGLNFIKTGIMKSEQGRLYATLSTWREKGDYGDMFDLTREKVEPLFEPTKEFLDNAKKFIEKSLEEELKTSKANTKLLAKKPRQNQEKTTGRKSKL